MLYHHRQNPLYTRFDDICEIFKRYACTFSLLRPGCQHDASDAAQLAELHTLGNDSLAWKHDVQVMVEGPGHVPLDQIEFNVKKQMEECSEAPFYVLGPGDRHRPGMTITSDWCCDGGLARYACFAT